VLAVEGSAILKHQGGSDAQPVTTSSRLPAGDSIRTTKEAQVRVMLVPGMLVALGGGCELQIEQLWIAKDGNAMVNSMRARNGRIRLMRGVLDGTLEQSDIPHVDLIVATTWGEIIARSGSSFRVEATPEHARILCVRGQLQLQAAHHPGTALDPGFLEDWPNLIGAAKAADSEAKAQEDLVAALEQERLLLLLENGERFAPAPWRRAIPKKP
jgi:hypothetical protein